MEFEWDEAKNQKNIRERGISFASGSRIFAGPVLQKLDNRRNYGEERIKVLSVVEGIILSVVYTMRGTTCRIISVRRANKNERRAYRQIYP